MSANGIQGTTAATQLYNTGAVQQPITPPEQATQKADSSTSAQKATGPIADQISFSSPVTRKNLDTVKAIEQLHNKMNSLIKGVRETNESINSAAEKVSRISSALEGITKNFPPFSLESKERQELLMSYTSIRQEILKMTIPPPPSPIYEKVKSMWDSILDQNGQIQASAVTPLDKNSSDQQVQAALSQTETTGNNLASLSSATTQALVQA